MGGSLAHSEQRRGSTAPTALQYNVYVGKVLTEVAKTVSTWLCAVQRAQEGAVRAASWKGRPCMGDQWGLGLRLRLWWCADVGWVHGGRGPEDPSALLQVGLRAGSTSSGGK